jgi:hypothetical protein
LKTTGIAEGRRLGGESRRRAQCRDDRDLAADQIGRQRRVSIIPTLSPAERDMHVLALDIASLAQALSECRLDGRRFTRRSYTQEPDYRHRRLSRTRAPHFGREQQTAASDQSNELTPFYVEHGDFLPYAY